MGNCDKKTSDLISIFCENNAIRLKIMLNMDKSLGTKAGLDIIGGFPIVDIKSEPLLFIGNRLIKRTLDIIVSLISIIIFFALASNYSENCTAFLLSWKIIFCSG